MLIVYYLILFGAFAFSFLGLIASFVLLEIRLATGNKELRGIVRTRKIVVSFLPFLIPFIAFILLLTLHGFLWNVHFWINRGVWHYQYLPIYSSYMIWVDESLESARLIKNGNRKDSLISGIFEYGQEDNYLAGKYLFEKPKQRYKKTHWFIVNLNTGEKEIYLDEESFHKAVNEMNINQFILKTVQQNLDDYWSLKEH